MMFSELGQMMADNANQITELQKENAELRAYCEILRQACENHAYMGTLNDPVKYLTESKRLAEQTPKQNLNEIKAQAIEEMIRECAVKVSIPAFAYGGCIEFKGLILVQDAEQYAKKLRGE